MANDAMIYTIASIALKVSMGAYGSSKMLLRKGKSFAVTICCKLNASFHAETQDWFKMEDTTKHA